MKRLKHLLLLVASIMLVACGGDDIPQGDDPQSDPPKDIVVETLPEGVEISDETQQLNNIQLENIESVDEENSTLTFSSSLPSDQIPQKGLILLQFSPTEELPYGFLGRVTDVNISGGKIIVETDAPALDEAFDVLKFDYAFDLFEGTRASFEKDEQGNNVIKQTLDGEYKVSDNITISLGGSFTHATNVVISSDINNLENLDNFSLKVNTTTIAKDISVKVTASTENYAETNKLFNVGKPITIPLNLQVIGIKTDFQVKLEVAIQGEASLGYSTSFVNTTSCYMRHSKEWGYQNTTPTGSSTSDNIVDHKVNFSLDGKFSLALVPAVEFKLFGRDELKITADPKAGFGLEGELDIELGKPEIDGNELYNTFKDTSINLSAFVGLDVNIHYGILKKYIKEPKSTIPIFTWNIYERDVYLFPEFKEQSLNISDDKADCTTTLGRDLLFNSGVGIAQYYEDKMVDHSTPLPYFLEEGFSNPIAKSFTHQDDYTYWTYVKWGDNYIKCEPVLSSIIGTWKCITSTGYEICNGEKDEWELTHDNPNEYFGFTFDFDGIGNYFEYHDGRMCNEGNFSWQFFGTNLIIKRHDSSSAYKVEKLTSKQLVLIWDWKSSDGLVKEYARVVYTRIK